MSLVENEERYAMDKFDKRTYEIIKRLQNARLNLLSKQPFYALLLLHMKFALDITCGGQGIYSHTRWQGSIIHK